MEGVTPSKLLLAKLSFSLMQSLAWKTKEVAFLSMSLWDVPILGSGCAGA